LGVVEAPNKGDEPQGVTVLRDAQVVDKRTFDVVVASCQRGRADGNGDGSHCSSAIAVGRRGVAEGWDVDVWCRWWKIDWYVGVDWCCGWWLGV
jgi:hypothetical protein